jgi:diaminopimelate epimerase
MQFYKYQGTGNDFVMIDNRSLFFEINNTAYINDICNRRFGVGADGLILLQHNTAGNIEMVYFNADGKQGSMCGNGGRCFVQFANDLNLFNTELVFDAVDGLHIAKIVNGLIELKMIDVTAIKKMESDYFMNTGSPHFVRFVDNIHDLDVFNEGKAIRHSADFAPDGTNVNFAQFINGELWVRTFERGVEDETYSCGTGVTAAAIAAQRIGLKSPIAIRTLGGKLKVSYTIGDNDLRTDVYLIGPAKRVFVGEL